MGNNWIDQEANPLADFQIQQDRWNGPFPKPEFDILKWLREEAILPDPDYRNQDILNDPTGYPLYVKAAALLKPESVLEIGTHYGAGLCAFATGHCSAIYWAIDNESYYKGSNQIAKINLQRRVSQTGRIGQSICTTLIRFFLSKEYMWAAPSKDLFAFDLIHVDADHTFTGALKDIEFAFSLCPKYVLVDDFKMKDVADAVRAFSYHKEVPFKIWNTLRGWAIFALNSEDFANLPDSLDDSQSIGLTVRPRPNMGGMLEEHKNLNYVPDKVWTE